MKPVWLILWAAVTWQVASWTFAPAPQPAPAAVESRDVPLDIREQRMAESRATQRKGALEALGTPFANRCGEARKEFLSAINEYYFHRQNQSERYPEIYGKAGADHIAAQWSTTDDSRIDRLTQEAYAQGYLKPSDFDGVARKSVAAVVRNERITGKGCIS
jgi:hypothetical protein